MQERQETRVWSLGWDDPLEEEMATHSSVLAWRIPRTKEPGGLQSMGSQRVRHDLGTKQHQQHAWQRCPLENTLGQLGMSHSGGSGGLCDMVLLFMFNLGLDLEPTVILTRLQNKCHCDVFHSLPSWTHLSCRMFFQVSECYHILVG